MDKKQPVNTSKKRPASVPYRAPLRKVLPPLPLSGIALADLPPRTGVSPTPALGVHVFRLTWDTSRARDLRERSRQKQHATGVKFDETGIAALSNGQTFENIDAMEHLLELVGEYAIDWL